jgi:periplasmic protein TonB
VHLIITISKEGNVIDAQLVSGPPQLVPGAITAVRQWRYKPYEVNGEPAQVVTQVDVQFPAKQ